MGCYASRAAEEVAALPGVAEVVADKERMARSWPAAVGRHPQRHFHLRPAAAGVRQGAGRLACGSSYCIIPQRPPGVAQPWAGRRAGRSPRPGRPRHREIVLVGIHLGHYGLDGGQPALDLARLVCRIAELDGEFRIRISSLDDAEVTPALIEAMADYPWRICPHLHLSMQSGSDRRPGADGASRLGGAAHRVLPGAVGGLGPARTRHQRDRRFPRRERRGFCGHVPGGGRGGLLQTARLPLQSAAGNARRGVARPRAGPRPAACAAALAELGQRLRLRYFQTLLGHPLQVLVEGALPDRPGRLLGTADRYAPVELSGPQDRVGRLVRVTARTVGRGRIQGEIAGDERESI